jgi:predicted SpoU family rRNA methylase
VFLDRFFAGEELAKDFGGAKMRIVPSARGKKIKSDTDP